MEKADRNRLMLDHAWRHFEFHAKQRLSLINFFIVLCGLIVAAWSQVMTADRPIYIVGIALGLLLCLFSLIFWRMDQRNAFLTKSAETVINEADLALFQDKSELFNEEIVDRPLRKGTKFIFAPQWSHGQSLRTLFSLVAIVGIMGTGYSALQLLQSARFEGGTPSATSQSSSRQPSRGP